MVVRQRLPDYSSDIQSTSETPQTARRRQLLSFGAFHESLDEHNLDDPETTSASCVDLNETRGRRQRRAAVFAARKISENLSDNFDSGCARSAVIDVYTNMKAQALDNISISGSKHQGRCTAQSSVDSNGDVGQISVNFMRVNGAIAPFRTLLTNPNTATAVVDNKTFQRVTSLRRMQSDHKTSDDYTVRRLSDAPIVVIEGNQSFKKKLLYHNDDVEAQKNEAPDSSKSPLMNAKEVITKQKSGRLIQRQELFIGRRRTCDYALLFSLFGIVMMIVETELRMSHNIVNVYNVIIKTITLVSTIILVALVIKFHLIEVQLYMNANSAEDWRIAITFRRSLQILAEIVACAICPLPFVVKVPMPSGKTVPLDVILSIPMFSRLYWAWRTHLLHSRMFTDASSRSIAGLNRVNFNARFIMKTLMTLCPGTMLIVFTATLWIVAAWILRLCESSTDSGEQFNPGDMKHKNYLNSLWLIAITFLSVGYGDIVPTTHCGRAAAVVTGILGTCTSSMIVAVIARKLELSRAEKHVHNFMMDTQLTKKLKHSAANVLRETWLIYKNRRLVDKIDPAKIRMHQRKFLIAINALRQVKREQRKLAENSVSLGDVAKTTSGTYEMMHEMHTINETNSVRLTALEHQIAELLRESTEIKSKLEDFDDLKTDLSYLIRHLMAKNGESTSSYSANPIKRHLH